MLTRRTLFASLSLVLGATAAEASVPKRKKPAKIAAKSHAKSNVKVAKATAHRPLARS